MRVKAAADLVLWRPAVSGMGSGMSRPRRPGFGLEASRGMLPLLALQVLMEYGRAGASRPPVTAALLAANTLIYLRPGALHEVLPSLNRVAFNPHLIIQVPNLAYLFIALSEFRRHLGYVVVRGMNQRLPIIKVFLFSLLRYYYTKIRVPVRKLCNHTDSSLFSFKPQD